MWGKLEANYSHSCCSRFSSRLLSEKQQIVCKNKTKQVDWGRERGAGDPPRNCVSVKGQKGEKWAAVNEKFEKVFT